MNPIDPAEVQTVEHVEALDCTDLDTLVGIADGLHADTEVALTQTSAELVQEGMQLRKAMKIKLDEALNVLSAKEADIDAKKRYLRIKKSLLVSDWERMQPKFYELLAEERRLQKNPYS